MDKKSPLSGFGSVAVHAGHEQDPLYAHLVFRRLDTTIITHSLRALYFKISK